jgi:uncharacterized protein YwgA
MSFNYFMGAEKKNLGNPDLVRLILWVTSARENENKVFKSITKLQKLVFLAQWELDEFNQLVKSGLYIQTPFDFVPDKYGMYSVDLTKLLRRMEKDGEINKEKTLEGVKYKINDKLKDELKEKKELLDNPVLIELLNKILDLSKLPLDALLKHIYSNPKYKELIKNSLIIDRILG